MMESDKHEKTESKAEQKKEYGGSRLPNKDVGGEGNSRLPSGPSVGNAVFKTGKSG